MVRLAALLFAFPIGLAGIILLIGRDWIGLVLLSAALLSAAIHFVPRGVRAVRRLIENRRVRRLPQPTIRRSSRSPPICGVCCGSTTPPTVGGQREAQPPHAGIGSRDYRSCAAGGACARCAAPGPAGARQGSAGSSCANCCAALLPRASSCLRPSDSWRRTAATDLLRLASAPRGAAVGGEMPRRMKSPKGSAGFPRQETRRCRGAGWWHNRDRFGGPPRAPAAAGPSASARERCDGTSRAVRPSLAGRAGCWPAWRWWLW